MRRSSLLRLALLALLGVLFWLLPSQQTIDPESTRDERLPLSLSKQDDPAGPKQRNDPSDSIQLLLNQKRSPPLSDLCNNAACRSPNTTTWSKHSRRADPLNRSTGASVINCC